MNTALRDVYALLRQGDYRQATDLAARLVRQEDHDLAEHARDMERESFAMRAQWVREDA